MALHPLVKSLPFQDIDEPADRMEQFRWNMVWKGCDGSTRQDSNQPAPAPFPESLCPGSKASSARGKPAMQTFTR